MAQEIPMETRLLAKIGELTVLKELAEEQVRDLLLEKEERLKLEAEQKDKEAPAPAAPTKEKK